MEKPLGEKQKLCTGCTISYLECKDYNCERVFDFFLSHGAITNCLKCPDCSQNIILDTSRKIFRCGSYKKAKKKKSRCNFEKSVWSGTFFEELPEHLLKLPESTVFRLVGAVLWLLPPRNGVIMKEFGMEEQQLSDWLLSLREVFIDAVSVNSNKLGGKNRIVELVDAKWKSDNVKGGLWDWAFGGIERKSGETFLVPVEHNNFQTLKEIIAQKINPETTIVTDCTNSLSSKEIEDLKKNLSVNFILPADSTMTAAMMHHWGEVRKGFINLSSKRPPYSIDQLAEYLFKSKHPALPKRIHAFFVAAGSLYPPDKVPTYYDYTDEDE